MEATVELAILAFVAVIAYKIARPTPQICPHCASLLLRPSASPAAEPQAAQGSEPQAAQAAEPQMYKQNELELAAPGGNVGFIEPWDQDEGRAPLRSGTAAEPSALVTGDVSPLATLAAAAAGEPELMLDTGGDTDEALLPSVPLNDVEDVANDELILEEEIGIGAMGWPMASRLVQAGFAVTSAPAQRRRDSKRLHVDSLDIPS